MIYYLSVDYFYCLNNSFFDYLRNFWNVRLDNMFLESLNENDFYHNLSSYFCLSLNNPFDIDFIDCLIDYIFMVRNIVSFFDLEIFRDSYFDKVIVVYRYYSYLGVVFLKKYYCECFCWVNSGLFLMYWYKDLFGSLCFCGLFWLSCCFRLHSLMLYHINGNSWIISWMMVFFQSLDFSRRYLKFECLNVFFS